MVDTGATFTVVPRPLLSQLGVNPVERRQVLNADRKTLQRDLGLQESRWPGNVSSRRFSSASKRVSQCWGQLRWKSRGWLWTPNARNSIAGLPCFFK